MAEQPLTFQEGLSFICILHDHSKTSDTTVHCVIMSTTNNALCIVMTNNTAKKYVTPSDDDVYLKNQASQNTCYITFSLYF
jgi:hypothetical protein